MKLFTSDLHINHKNMILHNGRSEFKSVDEMNDLILSNLYKKVKPGDDLYVLGDLLLGNGTESSELLLDILNKSKVKFYFIIGNHDKINENFRRLCTSISYLKEIKIGGNNTTLCHYPLLEWNKSHYNSFLLHGHIHKFSHSLKGFKKFPLGKVLNVNVEFHNYEPWTEEEVIEYMKNRPDNWDYIKKT
jgi:calcineurin-like phosphoesterase family protein